MSIASLHEAIFQNLTRVEECFSDGQDTDVGVDWLNTLTTLGLLCQTQQKPAIWEITPAGMELLRKPVGSEPDGWVAVGPDGWSEIQSSQQSAHDIATEIMQDLPPHYEGSPAQVRPVFVGPVVQTACGDSSTHQKEKPVGVVMRGETGPFIDIVEGAAVSIGHLVYLQGQSGLSIDAVNKLRYKAELYDEVWQLATGMGFLNVTTAIDTLRKRHDSLLRDAERHRAVVKLATVCRSETGLRVVVELPASATDQHNSSQCWLDAVDRIVAKQVPEAADA